MKITRKFRMSHGHCSRAYFVACVPHVLQGQVNIHSEKILEIRQKSSKKCNLAVDKRITV